MKIVRPKSAMDALGCRHSKFYLHYCAGPGKSECVPGTDIPRLKPFRLGKRNTGFNSEHVNDLVAALAELGAKTIQAEFEEKAEAEAWKLAWREKHGLVR
jgi:hypothetical protein